MLNIYPAGQAVVIERVIFDTNGELVAIETRAVSNVVSRHVHEAVAQPLCPAGVIEMTVKRERSQRSGIQGISRVRLEGPMPTRFRRSTPIDACFQRPSPS